MPNRACGAGESRRGFVATAFTWLGLGSLAVSLASTVYANFRFFFPKVLYEPPAQFKAGVPGDYQAGTVSDRWAKEHQVWIVREKRHDLCPADGLHAPGMLDGFLPGRGAVQVSLPRQQLLLARRSPGGTGARAAVPSGVVAGRGRADRGRQESARESAGRARPTTLRPESVSHGIAETQPMDHGIAVVAIDLPSRSARHAAHPLPDRLQQLLPAPAPGLASPACVAVYVHVGPGRHRASCCS